MDDSGRSMDAEIKGGRWDKDAEKTGSCINFEKRQMHQCVIAIFILEHKGFSGLLGFVLICRVFIE